MTKAKTSKVLRQLLEYFSDIPQSSALQSEVVKELIEWAKQDNRIYLRQNLETKLIALHLDNRAYTDALGMIAVLLKELKKLDDKMVLIEVQLLESRAYHSLRNLPKSRAALTSARTSANAIYCPPLVQAALDMQSGILHAEDKDFKTAFSYFYEAFEGYGSQEDARAIRSLKYMLLCKVMIGAVDEVGSVINSKSAQKYQGVEVEAMKAVSLAYKERSLQQFEKVLGQYSEQLQKDATIQYHLKALYENLLEENLKKIIEPYSRVQITHVAELVKLPVGQVEAKLSQMILDKKFEGTLDQSNGTLIVFEEPKVDQTYQTSLELVEGLTTLVDSLYEKARKL